MKIHFSLLDLVRFFAAFWVMNYHYFSGIKNGGELSWYRYGDLGVQLFFIISGFVIVQSFKGKTVKEFATNRFLRLFPLFWILCTITYLLTLFVPNGNSLLFTEYLRSMTMFGDIFNKLIGPTRLIDPSYWTLTVELIFYICIGIFVNIFSHKNIRYFLAIWLAFSMIAFALNIDQNFYTKLLLVRHASYFVFGSALALIVTKEAKNIYEKYFDWMLIFSSSIYSVFINTRAIPQYILQNPLDEKIIPILLVIFFISIPLLAYLSKYIKNLKVISVLAILGGITYPLYLLHQTVGNLLINYYKNISSLSWNQSSIVFEVIIIITAYFVYLKDKKMRKLLKEKISLL